MLLDAQAHRPKIYVNQHQGLRSFSSLTNEHTPPKRIIDDSCITDVCRYLRAGKVPSVRGCSHFRDSRRAEE